MFSHFRNTCVTAALDSMKAEITSLFASMDQHVSLMNKNNTSEKFLKLVLKIVLK